MSSQAAALQGYNNELVQCLEALKKKRDELQDSIVEEENEKKRLETDIKHLTEQLGSTNQSLAKKMLARNEIDKTILETETAYSKILESSQTLLRFLKQETTKTTSLLPGTSSISKKL